MKLKQFLSGIFALLFVLSLPVSALAADWDISKGDITVNAGSGGQTVTQGDGVAVEDSAPVITGSSTENTVTINAEKDQTANVTLSGANIDVSSEGKAAVSTTGEGNVSIELNGENALKSGKGHADLEKKNGGSLTIADENKNGKLTAEGGWYGAGIGGGNKGNGDNIAITGDEVEATGGYGGAGIGGGDEGSGRDIEITGGKVTASSKSDGAGIGGGNSGDGENITISGGEVTATGGSDEEGLSSGYGAGIGGGYAGDGRNIKIIGGKVTASSKNAGAGIGGGDEGNGEDITITGGEVKASSENVGAGIGGGYKGDGYKGDGKRIKITGGTVDAASDKGAGIGGGDDGDGENIAISGGKVTAKSSKNGAGIGGGLQGKGKDITVSGDAQLKVQGGVGDFFNGPGAGIGDGGSRPKGSTGGSPIPGAEVEPDICALKPSGKIEYYAPGSAMTGTPVKTVTNPTGDHVWDSGTVTKPATCTEKGVRTYTCTKHPSVTKTVDIPALNHSFDGQKYVSNNDATCEKDGTKTAKCVRYGTGDCMGTDTIPDTGSKLGHFFEEYVSDNNATYESDGTKTAKCVRYDQCGQTHTIPDVGSRLKISPLYRVTDKDGRNMAYTAEQAGGVLTVTVDADFAILTGSLSNICTLKTQGVEKIVFVTKGAASAFALADLLESGSTGKTYQLTHDGKTVTFTLGEDMADVSAILTQP